MRVSKHGRVQRERSCILVMQALQSYCRYCRGDILQVLQGQLYTHTAGTAGAATRPGGLTTAIYLSAYVYMCPHTTIYVSAYCRGDDATLRLDYCYICVLIRLYVCPHTYVYTCVLILQCMCPHTTIYVSAYCRADDATRRLSDKCLL